MANNRRSFIRDTLMILAISMLPKTLQPVAVPEIVKEMVKIEIPIEMHCVSYSKGMETIHETLKSSLYITVPKDKEDYFRKKLEEDLGLVLDETESNIEMIREEYNKKILSHETQNQQINQEKGETYIPFEECKTT